MTASESTQLHALVIEDDDALRRVITNVLQDSGHVVVPVGSAEEGLAQLPFWAFDIAFVDHHLPGIQGLVFGEFLRKNNPDILVVLVTGESDPKLRRQTEDLAIRFVGKPFEVEQIEALVGEACRGKDARSRTRTTEADADWVPTFGPHLEDIEAAFRVPGVPSRIEDRLTDTVKAALHDLRSTARYSEKDRIVALSGLLAARVLGMSLPRTRDGRSLYEEYDDVMRQHGRRVEFES